MVRLDDPNLARDLEREDLPRMSLGDHLDELRKRLIFSLLAIVAAVALVMPFKKSVQDIIVGPYRAQWRMGFIEHIETLEQKAAAAAAAGRELDARTRKFLDVCRHDRDMILAGEHPYPQEIQHETGYPVPYSLVAINGLEDIFVWMWAALVFALVIAAPVVVWQVWAFIAAGLYQRERRLFYRYFPFMMLLMAGGVSFGYFVALPFSLRFLIGMMDPSTVGAMLSIGQFLNLLLALTTAMGLVFQVPLVMVALQKIGLVTHAGFRKNWRATVLVIFILAALLTPPDPVSMLMMASPMLVLYGIGLLLTGFARRSDPPVVRQETGR